MPPVLSTANPRLPIELVFDIIDEVQYHGALVDRATLSSLSLVCRAWSLHAQTLLFSHAVVSGTHNLALLRSRLKDELTAKANTFATAVRILCIRPDYPYTPETVRIPVLDGLRCANPRDVADALILCPNVTELDWQGNIWHTLAPDARRIFTCAPPLRTLRLRGLTAALVCELVLVLPSLHTLEVAGTVAMPLGIGMPPIFARRRPACALRSLSWRENECSLGTLTWLLHASHLSLEALDVAGMVDDVDDVVAYVSGVHGAQLRSLKLGSCCVPSDFSAFPVLEEVAFGVYDPDAAALASLSRTITHVEMEGDVLGPLVSALDKGILPYLRTVTVRVPLRDGEPIHPVCAARGVKLVQMGQRGKELLLGHTTLFAALSESRT